MQQPVRLQQLVRLPARRRPSRLQLQQEVLLLVVQQQVLKRGVSQGASRPPLTLTMRLTRIQQTTRSRGQELSGTSSNRHCSMGLCRLHSGSSSRSKPLAEAKQQHQQQSLRMLSQTGVARGGRVLGQLMGILLSLNLQQQRQGQLLLSGLQPLGLPVQALRLCSTLPASQLLQTGRQLVSHQSRQCLEGLLALVQAALLLPHPGQQQTAQQLQQAPVLQLPHLLPPSLGQQLRQALALAVAQLSALAFQHSLLPEQRHSTLVLSQQPAAQQLAAIPALG